ncbi:hypothetical protein BC332_08286 [Capsicum chinense]|nr:hypothetical protein BC332_08286 [Capsicum chinense]
MSSKDKMTICPVSHSYTFIIVAVLVSKALAASEFKQAMVTHRRRRKVQPVLEGRSQLPRDVLVHVFGLIDLKSIFFASLVCRSWSVAASDNYLWQLIHISFFGKFSDNPNIIRLTHGVERISFTPENITAANVEVIEVFSLADIPLWLGGTTLPAMVSLFFLCRSQLPQDVLVHVFGFLDLKSVLTASLVCRSWSVAASDNYLWQLIHIGFFGKSSDNPNIIRLTYGVDTPVNSVAANLDWKDAFKQAYRGISIKATSQRGFCKRCKSFVWLSNSKCSNGCYGKISDEHQIMPVSLKQIVDYVTMEYSIPCLDCDRDSDDSVDGLDYSVYLDDSDDSVVGSPY